MLKIKMDRKDVGESSEVITAAGWELYIGPGRRSMDFVTFVHRKASPKTADEAYEFIRKTFFFAPYEIWIDKKKIEGPGLVIKNNIVFEKLRNDRKLLRYHSMITVIGRERTKEFYSTKTMKAYDKLLADLGISIE